LFRGNRTPSAQPRQGAARWPPSGGRQAVDRLLHVGCAGGTQASGWRVTQPLTKGSFARAAAARVDPGVARL